jgi:hypothetical protein
VKRIIYITYYFRPDLSAGSFRNSSLAEQLNIILKDKDIVIDLYTTLPNRYGSFKAEAPVNETIGNMNIYRISVPKHKSGMLDQILSYIQFYKTVMNHIANKNVDLVYVSSSRLFSAYLGSRIAKKTKAKLILDIRDIFVDSIKDVIQSKFLKFLILPFLKRIEKITFKRADHINLISPGFNSYFGDFKKCTFSNFTNGIDDEFLDNDILHFKNIPEETTIKIVYAGNIGEGQGLHKIIPQAAHNLGSNYQFIIIGDGGAKHKLESEIISKGLKNIKIHAPVERTELFQYYLQAHYLFIHLNDFDAFKKVLPSKVFELATFNKPIIAGVGGFAAQFIKNEISSSYVFEPCAFDKLINYLRNDQSYNLQIDRSIFVNKYKRSNINLEFATFISNYLN